MEPARAQRTAQPFGRMNPTRKRLTAEIQYADKAGGCVCASASPASSAPEEPGSGVPPAEPTRPMPGSWLRIPHVPTRQRGSVKKWQLWGQWPREIGPEAQGRTGVSLGRRNPSREPPPHLPPGQIWDKLGPKRIKAELVIHKVHKLGF